MQILTAIAIAQREVAEIDQSLNDKSFRADEALGRGWWEDQRALISESPEPALEKQQELGVLGPAPKDNLSLDAKGIAPPQVAPIEVEHTDNRAVGNDVGDDFGVQM